ncbi:MAG: Alginate biosynthesis protein AlgA [Chloroflexi bacterium]|nr:Alginate biosynthesis protein AlgA [Chloroflexota bacterium]
MSEYVAIVAGGSGTRLWPLSRSTRPKQLLPLLGDRSLIQSTVDRVRPLVPPERILIVTEASHSDDLRAQLPEIPAENVLVEPVRRGTAAAIGLAATWIAHHDPSAVMASLWSDAAVMDDDGFRAALVAAFAVARSGDWLVTLGMRPTSPHTGMGYIQVGLEIGTFEGHLAHQVVRFVEKPDRATAEQFVRDGYVWNPGMFAWRVDVILAEFARLLPTIYGPLSEVSKSLGTAQQNQALRALYPLLPTETIDYGILERADRIATIPSSFGWSDVGSWAEILAISPKDDHGNVVRGQHFGLETSDTLIHGSGKPVFTLGVEDLVIVDLPDALLVCHRDHAERVKQLVEQLQADARWAGLL